MNIGGGGGGGGGGVTSQISRWGGFEISMTPLPLPIDMEVLQKEAALKQKELSKVEKLNKKLHDELQSLNVHMTTNMVSKTDLELYKRAVNEKVMKA